MACICHLSLLDTQVLQSPYTWFAVSRRQHQVCFRKALCTKFLQNWEVKAVAFSENDWLFWWSKESPSRDEQGTPLLSVSDEALEWFGGQKIALFNDTFKVNLLHLQTGKVDHLLLFSAHAGSSFHKSDSCWKSSCLAPVTVPWIGVFISWCARKCLALCDIITFSFFLIYFFPNKSEGKLHYFNFVIVPTWKGSYMKGSWGS